MKLLLAISPQAQQACDGLTATGGACDNGTGIVEAFGRISNTLIFVIGAIAVIMVIIGALRYVLSNGDAAGLKSAKDTIMYALIGIVVALLSYALVAFVTGRFS